MHASFKIGETTSMASNGMAQGKPEFKGISLSWGQTFAAARQ